MGIIVLLALAATIMVWTPLRLVGLAPPLHDTDADYWMQFLGVSMWLAALVLVTIAWTSANDNAYDDADQPTEGPHDR